MLGRVDEEAESLVHNAIEELEHRHAEEKRSWEKEKTRFLDIRLSLEEELTRVNAEQDDLRGQAESLSTELEQVCAKEIPGSIVLCCISVQKLSTPWSFLLLTATGHSFRFSRGINIKAYPRYYVCHFECVHCYFRQDCLQWDRDPLTINRAQAIG